jgi:hypothetical protein
MAVTVRRVEYYHTEVKDRPGEAYALLSRLASQEVNLLAFSAVPTGPENTQLVLFPQDVERLARVAAQMDLVLIGPHHAFLIQGDDQLGALADLHHRLADARINIYASSGVTDGRGGYGYVLYVRPESYDSAANVLGV